MGIRKYIATLPIAVLAVSGLTALPAAAQPQSHAAAAARCTIRDGTSPTGGRIGSNPTKYRYGNSPYLGVRYNSCQDTFRVYYGGYTTNLTHYNLRWYHAGWHQTEMRPFQNGLHTMTAIHSSVIPFLVQACNRGGILQRSSCTRWSPTVTLHHVG
jgi:hypothetical protein